MNMPPELAERYRLLRERNALNFYGPTTRLCGMWWADVERTIQEGDWTQVELDEIAKAKIPPARRNSDRLDWYTARHEWQTPKTVPDLTWNPLGLSAGPALDDIDTALAVYSIIIAGMRSPEDCPRPSYIWQEYSPTFRVYYDGGL